MERAVTELKGKSFPPPFEEFSLLKEKSEETARGRGLSLLNLLPIFLPQ